MKNPGKILKLENGSVGVAYNKEQENRLTPTLFIRLVNSESDLSPKHCPVTGNEMISIKKFSEVEIIGFIN